MKIFDRLDNYVNDKKFSMIYKNNKLDIINYSKIIEFTSTIISVSYNNKIYQYSLSINDITANINLITDKNKINEIDVNYNNIIYNLNFDK